MTVEIQKISKLEWEKKWAASFALPLTTMLSDWYYNECAKQWEGRNFKRMFFVVTRAMVTCYQAPA